MSILVHGKNLATQNSVGLNELKTESTDVVGKRLHKIEGKFVDVPIRTVYQ